MRRAVLGRRQIGLQKRTYTQPCTAPAPDPCSPASLKKGLVVGAYDGCTPGEYRLTCTGCKVDDESGGRVCAVLRGSGLKQGGAQIVSSVCPDYYAVAVAGLGPDDAGYNETECIDECKENIRVAAAVGSRALQDQNVNLVMVEGFKCSEAAAEGSILAVWQYQELKNKDDHMVIPKIDLYEDPDREGWQNGVEKACAQNLARRLEETPSNIMTPSMFAKTTLDTLCPCNVHVEIRDKDWIESKKLGAFLSMSKGSCEAPLLLELSYCGGQEGDRPVVLVGKGLTYDSGGVCLRPCKGMAEYSADMAGAAVIVGVMKALAGLGIPLNVNALIPLCENMPGGLSMKPGDVVVSHAGKSILVERTDHEGRVILADALSYSCIFKPCIVISIATLTYEMRTALGSPASGAFCTSNQVWSELVRAGAETGDRVWRFPFWKVYAHKITNNNIVDVTNSSDLFGDPCMAAAFLKEFAPCVDFLHLDITGTGMLAYGETCPYLRSGLMTGRPTRTLIQFLYQMACPCDRNPCM